MRSAHAHTQHAGSRGDAAYFDETLDQQPRQSIAHEDGARVTRLAVAVEDPEWPPAGPVYAGELPQGHVVAICGPQPIVDVQEDEHNVGGVLAYAPIYPATPEASPRTSLLNIRQTRLPTRRLRRRGRW